MLLTIRSPAVGDVVDERGGADHVGAAPPSPRARAAYCSAAPQVTTSSTAAWKPSRQSRRTSSSGACRASLVRKRDALAGRSRSAATAAGAPGERLVADPEAAVEIEQHVVVAVEGRIELHGEQVSSPAMPRLLPLLLARVLLASASPPGAATTTSPRRRPRPPPTATPEDTGGEQASGCTPVDPAAAQAGRGRPSPRRSSTRRRPTWRRSRRTAASSQITLDAEARAEDRRRVQGARRRGLLRRAPVPPDRARLRDPGRRPEGQRHRRPGLQRRRGAAAGPHLHEGRRRDGQDRGRGRRARPAASSSWSPARTPACRPSTRCSARSPRARRSST